MPVGKPQVGCHVPFTEECCRRLDWWNAAEMVVLLKGSPISIEEL
jgi:hypothetical protein